MSIETIFLSKLPVIKGVFIASDDSDLENQSQTNEIFSDKWIKYSKEELQEQEKLFQFQKDWYLDLYSFRNEGELKSFLEDKEYVLDAGCGLGYKAKWFADLSPSTKVIGMDYSDSAFVAAEKYKETKNLFFVKGDIADTKIKDGVISYVSCDQVIHHTEDPVLTIQELTRILEKNRELAVYVYAKKAIPRELLDEYFRKETKNISSQDMWEMSEQLTNLGRELSSLNIQINVPEIPQLGIKGGKMDIQRFIYWNFIKCFWNDDFGYQTSVSTNYDWYAPSNANRYSLGEFKDMLIGAGLTIDFIHSEEACHSGRFKKAI